MLSLVALGAIGCAGEWAVGIAPVKIGCLLPLSAVPFYQGGPLTLLEYISRLGAPLYFTPAPNLVSCERFAAAPPAGSNLPTAFGALLCFSGYPYGRFQPGHKSHYQHGKRSLDGFDLERDPTSFIHPTDYC
jgi:hypothetical protein